MSSPFERIAEPQREIEEVQREEERRGNRRLPVWMNRRRTYIILILAMVFLKMLYDVDMEYKLERLGIFLGMSTVIYLTYRLGRFINWMLGFIDDEGNPRGLSHLAYDPKDLQK